jgi:hypothetical protein
VRGVGSGPALDPARPVNKVSGARRVPDPMPLRLRLLCRTCGHKSWTEAGYRRHWLREHALHVHQGGRNV